MTGVGFLFLFGLSSCLLFLCKGNIISPPVGTEYVFKPGETRKIKWEFNGNPAFRSWSFTSSANGSSTELLATVSQDGGTNILNRLLEFDIERPATLVLKNVNQSYDGVYQFSVTVTKASNSDVKVFIAKKPNVTLNCSSYNEVNEGDDFTCECRDLDGNPPSNVTWCEDGNMCGGIKKENNTLTLNNVIEADGGNYTCVARSHTGDEFMDNKTIAVQVRFSPFNTTRVKFKSGCYVLDSTSCTVTCESSGFPAPNHTIYHNGSRVVSTSKSYIIDVVKYSDAGIYKCVAKNALGNDSASANLTVSVMEPSTSPPPTTTPLVSSSSSTPQLTPQSTQTTMSTSTTEKPDPDDSVPVWVIVIIIIAVLLVLLIIGYVIYRIKKKEKEGYSGNADVSPGDDGGEFGINHYELDEPPASADNDYATVSNETQKKPPPPENTEPAVYASVNKDKSEGKPLYATLDSLALEQGDKSKKKPKDERPPQTEYASIDFAKIAKNGEE